MSSTILKVEGLSLRSSNGQIFPPLSFQIDKGEIVALTGKSGSGKTTIALAILGLLPAGVQMTGGIITWWGSEPPISFPEHKAMWATVRGSSIGYIQQDVFGIFDPVIRMGKQMMMIVYERKMQPGNVTQDQLKSVMREVGLEDSDRIWNSYPHQLSGGQLQRCQISLSILIGPQLIIADEPTSAIDKVHQLEILDLFARLREKYGMAILCITHEDSVVRYLADREIQLEALNSLEVISREPIKDINKSEVPVLEISGLGFEHRFGGLVARRGAKVYGLDFSLSKSRCLGIIGESGSGKSTVAQMLVGLLVPSEGILKLNGKIVDFRRKDHIRLLREHIQLVMQDGRGSLHPNKTIRTLLHEVLVHQNEKSNSYRDIDLAAILRDVGITGNVLDRKADSLSGGECLRVSIARALLLEPAILVCDESTTSLDIPTRNGIIQLFQSLMDAREMSLVIISHDGELISAIADEILVFSEGTVVEKGVTTEILDNPIHKVTQKIFLTQATLSQKKAL